MCVGRVDVIEIDRLPSGTQKRFQRIQVHRKSISVWNQQQIFEQKRPGKKREFANGFANSPGMNNPGD
jgi:hypothetical protein